MLIKIAFLNLLRNYRRSLVGLLTVGFGVTALFLFDGFNKGIMRQYKDNTVHAKYGHGQINTKGYREEIFEKPWEHWIQEPETLMQELRQIPGVSHVFPRIEFPAMLQAGELNVAGRGLAVDGHAEADFFNTMNFIEGQTLRDEPNGIILGQGLARALAVSPGDRVTIVTSTVHGSLNGGDFILVGIFQTGLKELDDSHFRIQRAAAAPLLDTDRVESIALGLHQDEDWPAVTQVILSRHPELDLTSFAVLDKVYYQNAVDWLGQQFIVIQWIIILIVALGIGNTMAFTVLERTTEIGHLRANGESARDVLMLLLWEGTLIGLIGSICGILLGWILNMTLLKQGILMPPAPGLTRQFFVKIELQPMMLVISCLLGTVTAAVATGLAASGRVRMPIAAALRYR
ncbi:ABC transporter permease [Oligoflexus tunisiensis]|uniref:ABC transporter permease n=1 Tax=Oligoflexus tunisiensis TaxID=708132 RepID=UPI00114CE7CD|nr:FtsX-like permease family protein [Oligoflexus tunisiensis]